MAEREIYKGIEFVRISKLSTEQKEIINVSFPKDKIIKILREDEVVLNDCIQYHEYLEWFKKYYLPHLNGVSIKPETKMESSLRLIRK
jgi:hypothetical protein